VGFAFEVSNVAAAKSKPTGSSSLAVLTGDVCAGNEIGAVAGVSKGVKRLMMAFLLNGLQL